MEFTKENLNLENGLEKEWLITNGIGGYSSSTIIGANTRKYHGLLVAPLTPPARRFLILSKLDESIEINEKKYDLYTNICKKYISRGYEYQEEFRKEYVPIFKYKIGSTEITKVICMEYGKNTVGVYYKIRNGENKAKLTLAPIINFRDFHSTNTDHEFNLSQSINKNKVKIVVDSNSQTPIYMNLSEGNYIKHENDNFKNMFYIEEEKRGFEAEENHAVPGRYEIEINPEEEKEISFVCSLEENIEQIDVKQLIDKEIIRLGEIFNQSLLIDNRKEKKTKEEIKRDNLIKTYLIATDNFVVYRPNFGLHTVIAGYPWFLDWGRDTLIAFEGLLLVTKRFNIAKEVLKTMIRDIKFGLVPNGYSGYDNRPLYNSVDASLLLFEAVQKYINYTGDYQFIKEELYEKLEDIIENYIKGIDVDNNNIYLDDDDLIVSGTQDTQNTWMDAKYDGVAITPRSGKAVEVNSLWYNANKIMVDLSKKFGHSQNAKKYKLIAEKCKKSFNDKFYNKRRKCLYDVLGDSKVRPNQLFAIGLTYPVIDCDKNMAKEIFLTCTQKLLNKYGMMTLAEDEPGFTAVYKGNPEERDSVYHQGPTWPWLIGPYYSSLKNLIKYEKNDIQRGSLESTLVKLRVNIANTFLEELMNGNTIGSICELYDSKDAEYGKGAFAQAWSVSEVFKILLEK